MLCARQARMPSPQSTGWPAFVLARGALVDAVQIGCGKAINPRRRPRIFRWSTTFIPFAEAIVVIAGDQIPLSKSGHFYKYERTGASLE